MSLRVTRLHADNSDKMLRTSAIVNVSSAQKQVPKRKSANKSSNSKGGFTKEKSAAVLPEFSSASHRYTYLYARQALDLSKEGFVKSVAFSRDALDKSSPLKV